MLNELRWAAGIQAFPEASFVEEQEGRWVDLQVIPEIPPAPRTEVASRRGALRDLFGAAFDCRVILLTLGLVEAWFDEETGVFLNRAPGFWTVKRNPGRFTFHVLDGASNREALEEIRGLLLARDGDRRFVVTVSPVPLSETFSGNDVLVANTYSKATLRTVAGDFARAHPDVDYFPSYEIASLSDRRVAFQEDLHHVHPAVVDVIVSTFLKCYGEAEAAPPDPDQVTQQRLASLEGSLLAENAALRAEVSHLRGELINREESGVGPIADGLTLSPSGVIRDRDGRFLVASEHLDGTAEIGCLAEGEVLVTGWAADRRPVAGPVAVVVFRDAALVAMILPTIRRPDVGAALGLDSPDCGFEMRFPVPATSGVFRVYCVSSGGEARELNYLCSFSLPSEGDGPVLAAGEPKHREGILHQT
jgi:hypothetical protein